MGEGLFRFVFNTLQPRMAEPGTRFYLPTVLTDLTGSDGGKVLPLHGDQWKIGSVSGDSGQTINNLFTSSFNSAFDNQIRHHPEYFDPPIKHGQFRAILTPGEDGPTLNVSNATVEGLENARLEPDLVVSREGNGYTAQVTIAFGTFEDLPKALRVTGGFQLDRWLSIADAKTGKVTTEHHTAPFDWPTFDVAGTGTFELSVTSLWADVDWTLTVDRGQPVVGIEQVTLRGDQGGRPTLTLEHVKVDKGNPYIQPSVWEQGATEAFNSDDGRRELIARIQDTLNEPDNRDSLARALTDNLRSTLDRSIGTADGSTSVDDNLFDRFRQAVGNPDSDYYLPAGVFAVTSPSLDPYRPDTISVQVTLLGKPVDIDLQDNTLLGAANALAPADRLVFDPGVRATVELSTLADGTKVEVTDPAKGKETRTLRAPLTLSGTAVVTIQGQKPMTGAYTVTIANATVDVTLPTDGGAHNALDTLTITCTALTVHADTDDIDIKADVGGSFKAIVNKELNKRENKQLVLDRINQELGEAGTLADLGTTITQNVRAMLTARLDG